MQERANLDWSLEVAFANYFSKVQVHFIRLDIEWALRKKIITCQCDIFKNTMLSIMIPRIINSRLNQ